MYSYFSGSLLLCCSFIDIEFFTGNIVQDNSRPGFLYKTMIAHWYEATNIIVIGVTAAL